MNEILDVLEKLGECSLRRLWIELRFPPIPNLDIDRFLESVEQYVKSRKIHKRTEATGVHMYSLMNHDEDSEPTYTNQIIFIRNALLENPNTTLPTLVKMSGFSRTTLTCLVTALMQLKIISRNIDHELTWNVEVENTYANLDNYISTLSRLQAEAESPQ